jgi:uncharacterized protein YciI
MRSGLRISLCLLWLASGSAALGAEQASSAAPPAMKDVPKDMKQYFVAFLVAGPKYTAEQSPERMALIQKHLAFLRRLIEEKKLRLAGPLVDKTQVFGLTIVAASSLEEATAWMDGDPAVQAGFFGHEIHPALFPALESLRIRF